MYRLGQQHRQQPEGQRGPALKIERQAGNHRIAKQMQAGFADDAGLMRGADIRLNDDAARASDDADNAVVPIGRAKHPFGKALPCIGLTR